MKRLPDVREIWNDLVERDPAATFYHTPIWRDMITSAFPHLRDVSIAYELDDGEVAFMPRLEHPGRYRVLRSLESTVPGTYGGWLASRVLTDNELSRLYTAADKRTAFHSTITLPPGHREMRLPRGYRSDVDFTQILSTRRQLTDEGHVRWDRPALRWSVGKAARAGLEVREAGSLEDYRSYFEVYVDTLDRWGDRATSQYPWTLFEAGHAASERAPGTIRLWLAFHQATVVAGMWLFYWKENAYNWHSAVLRDHMKLRPMDFLVTAVTEHAAHNSFPRLDLMPSGGHTGVAQFKEKFGAEKVPVHRLRRIRRVPAALANGISRLRRLRTRQEAP